MKNKFDIVNEIIRPDHKNLLDVGCRDGILTKYIPKSIEYTGVDIEDGELVDQVVNLEKGLPFEDNTFDIVTALDVLEHTENIWYCLGELVRVSKDKVVVVLPNAYHWYSRLLFLFGSEMNKYKLSAEPIQDRHRWLLSHNGIENFAKHSAKKYGLNLSLQTISGQRRWIPMDFILGLFSKNLSSWATILILSKSDT